MSDLTEPRTAKVDPGPTEDQKTFMARCMHEEVKFKDLKQRVAVCMSKWSKKSNAAGAGCPDPADGEDQQAYLDRCSVDHPQDQCQMMWDKMQGGPGDGQSPAGNSQHVLSVFTIAQQIPIRREQLDGVEHVVLPIVALVEGTFTCANCNGPNFYSAGEWGKNPQAWNGRPITIGHPMRGDSYVSAGSPDVWGKERVGTVFNARVEGDKLHVEAWIDPAAIKRAGGDAASIMAAVEDGGQVEVSTAAWVDEVPRVGSHNGKSYSQAQINFQPDHIALLWGQKGACNWADGCGVRVASADDVSRETAEPKAQCCDACAHGEPCTAEIQATIDALTAAIEVLTGHGFTVTFDEGDGDMAEDPKQAAETTPSDTPKQLDLPVHAEATKPQLPKSERQLAELQAEVDHLKAQLQAKPKTNTLDEYLEQAPVEIRDELFRLHKAAAKRKLELIDQIKQAPGCMWDEDGLKAKDEAELLKLVSLVARTDYSVQPPERRSQISYAASDDDFAAFTLDPWAPIGAQKKS